MTEPAAETARTPEFARIDEVTGIKERGALQVLFGSQPFWVTVALAAMCLFMSWYTEAFGTTDNFYNITRNFAFIGIMALGMTAVILTGGIDLSVGSLMGVVGVVIGLTLQASALPIPLGAVGFVTLILAAGAAIGLWFLACHTVGRIHAVVGAAIAFVSVLLLGGLYAQNGGDVFWLSLPPGTIWLVAILVGLMTGIVAGAVNGALIAYVGLPPFVVTLGMLSIARSLAIVFSQNKMIYEFGADAELFGWLGGGHVFGISNPIWVLVVLTAVFGFVFNLTSWGRYLYAIGGNENAARLTGVPVDRIKLEAYIVSGLTAALASILIVGWQGSAINALGTGYELRVIASTVIGGANLMGGEGGAYGAFIGSALIEVIRNALLMAGVDSNWQGLFVGVFIILAVLLQWIRGRKAD